MSLFEGVRFVIGETTRFVSPSEIAAEWVLVALSAFIIAAGPARCSRWLQASRNAFLRIAGRKNIAVLICGLLPVALRLSMLGFAPVPEPSIHDEFSHLLLGDTLAHGRLTNPTHPLWQRFESIHIIQQPTYSSMYPPAQGGFLALGIALFHEPWAGVVISVGLMSAAVCWMMQGWMAPAWVLCGTLIMILKICLTGLWINSYMGGAASAIGGALMLGSLARFRLGQMCAGYSILFGIGAVILMNSRPFEGAVLTIAVLAYLLPRLIGAMKRNPRQTLSSGILPDAVIIMGGAAFTGYYSWRVTGSPLRMLYQVNRDTYGWPENLGILPAKKVTLRHKALQDIYVKEVNHREIYRHPLLLIDNLITRVFESWSYFVGPVLTAPLAFLP